MAKFREFFRKYLLADTDYLVGHDADGRYIRISRADLAASVAANTTAPTLTVQYSANGESWHDSYVSGDHYVRINVEVPRNLNREQKEKLREFERSLNEKNYAKKNSFKEKLDKLKDIFK